MKNHPIAAKKIGAILTILFNVLLLIVAIEHLHRAIQHPVYAPSMLTILLTLLAWLAILYTGKDLIESYLKYSILNEKPSIFSTANLLLNLVIWSLFFIAPFVSAIYAVDQQPNNSNQEVDYVL